MRKLTKSLKKSLGDESHKFPVLNASTRKSITYLELYPEEKYKLDRTQSKSATIERLKYIKIKDQTKRLKMMKAKQSQKKENSTSSHSLRSQRAKAKKLQNEIEISDSLEQIKSRKKLKKRNKKNRVKEIDEADEEKKNDDEEEEDEIEWNVGCLIRVHHNERKYGFTQHLKTFIMDEDDVNRLVTYGPYRSSFANVLYELIEYKHDIEINHEFSHGSIVLIATGAGASYIIEFIIWLRNKFKNDENYILLNEIRIHFSCRSIRLFQWVTDFLCEKKFENLSIYAHFTSHKNVEGYDDENDEEKENLRPSTPKELPSRKKKRNQAKIGRASFEDVLNNSPKHSTVFFCGSPFIQKNIKNICKHLGFAFYEGHTF